MGRGTSEDRDDSQAGAELRNISRTMLRDQTYASLKRAILTGKIAQGEKLAIRKLAAQSDFSSTPIREGLLKLEQDGIVVRTSGGQFFVRRFSRKEVDRIFQLRILLETYGAAEAMESLTRQDVLYLEENIKKSEDALARGLIHDVSVLNMEFHHYLAGISKDEILQDLLQRISDKVWINTSKALQASGKAEKSIVEHKKIVRALKSRNLKEVNKILKIHILSAIKIALNGTAAE
jgi:DNA-binding GntR family transcriptional regulator